MTLSNDARAVVLARIREASSVRPTHKPIPPQKRTQPAPGDPDLFVERVSDYRAFVQRVRDDGVGDAIARLLSERGVRTIVVPDGISPSLLRDARAVPVRDHPPLTPWELSELDGAVTFCSVAIAETGTIILTHGVGEGRRALTLVPDYLLIIVREEQIVEGVPDAIALLDPSRPTTWISGPSATSDIELSRVEGVHGPRSLDVLVVGGDSRAVPDSVGGKPNVPHG